MPQSARRKLFQTLSEPDADALLHDWRFWARDDQVAPPGNWPFWLFVGGRGAGKTRSGAEWVREQVLAGAGRIALVGPTAYDARHVMVQGVSGLLSVCWDGDRDHKGDLVGRPIFEPGNRRVVWRNGAVATLFSAEEPERLRGPQHEKAWADELGAWKKSQETWDQLLFGLRLGVDPQCIATTTPRPIPVVRELVRDPECVITRARTLDNKANLSPRFFSQVVKKYEGTRLGRQELDAELLDEAEGALWNRDQLEVEGFRVAEPPSMRRVCVAVDPPASKTESSALCGIVVCALGEDDRGYVLEDLSARMTPAEWGGTAAKAYEDWAADIIIGESNQGGDMVRHTIRTALPNAPVKLIHAYRGKYLRAEPVAALYEQKRISHVGAFPELEDQMCTWEPLGETVSPDRLDAMVHGFSELMLGQTFEWYVGQ